MLIVFRSVMCRISKSLVLITISVCLFSCVSCSTADEDPDYLEFLEENEQFGGGIATVFDESENAFGNMPPALIDRNTDFVVGNSFFRRYWVTEPASTSDLDGLGPLVNARSCGNCHFKDGRGAPPLTPDERPIALLFRLSQESEIEWEQIPDPNYGGQFNPFGIFGVGPEGNVSVAYMEKPGTYPDGTSYSLRDPIYTFKDLNYGAIDGNTNVSPRVAPHIIGLGLLEAIAEADILANADEFDANGDGISGRPNYVFDAATGEEVMGRFGWKSYQPHVRQQVASAFIGDIGITSSLFPSETCADSQQDCINGNAVDDVELRDDLLDIVTFYTQALAIPQRRDWDQPQVLQGKALFSEVQSAACHTPVFQTSAFDDIPEYSDQTIRPYTDLLLHDMGEDLADGAGDHRATGTEWRTPPLWGLGLVKVVNDHTNFLHDGRARNFEEAILWHGGEAQDS